MCWYWAYLNLCCVWMFSKQFITNFTSKALFWEAEIYFKFCFQNAGNAISETQGGEKNGPFGSFVPPLKNPLKNALKVPMRNEVNNVWCKLVMWFIFTFSIYVFVCKIFQFVSYVNDLNLWRHRQDRNFEMLTISNVTELSNTILDRKLNM
jgi:hypothetical protein